MTNTIQEVVEAIKGGFSKFLWKGASNSKGAKTVYPSPVFTSWQEAVDFFGSEEIALNQITRMTDTDIKNRVRQDGLDQGLTDTATIWKQVLGFVLPEGIKIPAYNLVKPKKGEKKVKLPEVTAPEGTVFQMELTVGQGRGMSPLNWAFHVFKNPELYTVADFKTAQEIITAEVAKKQAESK